MLQQKRLIGVIAFLLLVCFSFVASVFAEVIVFKWGAKVEAEIIERTDEYIKIKTGGTELVYRLEDIESIAGETSTKATSVGSEEKTATQIFKQLSPAVVYIRALESQGSGFIVDKTGVIVTNWHVVGSSDEISVSLKDGTTYPCTTVINYDILKDICVLKIDAPDELPFIPLGKYDNIDIGETAYVIGNPLGLKYRISDGIVAQKEEDALYGRFIQFTCPISAGSSGSPLLNIKGEAIGMVTSTIVDPVAQNLNFAISSDGIKVLLAENRHLSPSDFAEMTKGHALIQQGSKLIAEGSYVEAYKLYKSVFQKNCAHTGIGNEDCLYLFFEMLKISGRMVGQWGTIYWGQFRVIAKAELERRESLAEVPREQWEELEMCEREMLSWADENIALIETAGGLKKVFAIITSANLVPPELWDEYQEALCLGYYNAAAAAAYNPDGREHYYHYFGKVKEAFPESESAKQLVDSEAIGNLFWEK